MATMPAVHVLKGTLFINSRLTKMSFVVRSDA